MAVTDQQKLDFLLKKIGYTKTKTGSVVGTGAISGTPKQPFAEAIPSPLIIANSALWNESGSIPTTPPGSDTAQVKVYLAATSGLRMTADSTSSGQRAFIAYSTYGNASSTRLTNWIDTQFGSAYLIKVYKGDPNSGGVALSAAGSGANDGWFFDYSAGVLNFNDTNVPSGVTDTNIYIVGYRYIGLTGAPTPTGGGNFTFNDLVVSRNLSVGGLSTFTGDAIFNGNVSIAGTLTYEDVQNVDAVGLITARSGIRVTGGVIEAQAGENKIPSLYAAMGNLPSAGSYHGMFAHVHATGRGYFAHAGNWYELVNKETNGTVGTGTETYNIGSLTATAIDLNGDLDVDGHTNLDNVSVVGMVTVTNVSSGTALKLIDSSNKQFVAGGGGGGSPFAGSGTNHDFRIQVGGTQNAIFKYGAGATGNLELGPASGIGITFNGATGNAGFVGIVTATTFKGDGDFVELDVDGHTNLDNVSVAGISTFSGIIDAVNTPASIRVAQDIQHKGDADTKITFTDNQIDFQTGGSSRLYANNFALYVKSGFPLAFLATSGATPNIKSGGTNAQDLLFTTGSGNPTRLQIGSDGTSTFSGDVQFDSGIKAGGSTGNNGEYLKSTGSGVAWSSFPSLRTRQTFTASAGQTTFSFAYTVGFLDVYVNGIKLTDAEFTATNGSTTVLSVGCFVGDIVELVAYNTVSASGSAFGIGNLVEDLSPQLGGDLDLFNKSITGTGNINITGVITATKFVGDGSGLTGIIASGSGVVIKHDGNTVGTAGTINFSTNLDVSPVSAGIVTITASGGGGGGGVSGINTIGGVVSIANDLDVDGHTNLDNVNIAGVTTMSGALFAEGNSIEIRGTNPYLALTDTDSNPDYSLFNSNGVFSIYDGTNSANRLTISSSGNVGILQDLDVDGHTNLDNVSIAGVATVTSFASISDIRSDALTLKNAAGSASYATFTNGGSATLNWNNTPRLQTTNAGITVTGTVAATSYTGDGSQLTGIVAGITTISGVVNIVNDLDVDGHTNLDNVSIAGVTTLSGGLQGTTGTFSGNISGNQGTFSGNITGPLLNISPASGNDGIILVNSAGGQNNDFSRIRQDISDDTFKIENKASGSYESLFEGTGNAGVKLFFSGDEKFETTAKGIQVGTGVTVETNGQAFFAGIVTATSFIGDGGGLTNVIGSGSGVIIKEGGTTVGTAGTINFVGVDVTDVSAGVVTVSTATTSIIATVPGSAGQSKIFVNEESTTSNKGSFEVFLRDNNSSEEVLSMYEASAGYARIDLHHGNLPTTVEVNAKTVYSGYARHKLRFTTNNASYGGLLDFLSSTGSWNFYSTYQGQQKNLISFNYNTIGVGDDIYPTTNNAFDLGFSNYKFRELHVTNVNAGVVTATAFHGDGSNLTGISGGGGADVGITTNISGSFTASAGAPSTINTYGYSSNDRVVEYTILIEAGPNFQSQKILAMRSGSTVHSTQFAVMFSSSLLVQCDVIISGGNMLLRATPETGVSGTTAYKIKREVM